MTARPVATAPGFDTLSPHFTWAQSWTTNLYCGDAVVDRIPFHGFEAVTLDHFDDLLIGHFDFAAECLLDIDLITYEPQFELVEFRFPACFEVPHPLAVFVGIVYIDYDFGKRVGIENAFVMPVAFDCGRFEAGGAELVNDLF